MLLWYRKRGSGRFSGSRPPRTWNEYTTEKSINSRSLFLKLRSEKKKKPAAAKKRAEKALGRRTSDQPPADRVIEAVLFSTTEPLSSSKLVKGLRAFYTRDEVVDGLRSLQKQYESGDSGLQLMEVAGGWQLVTRPAFYEYISLVLGKKKKLTISPAGLETLSLIAYKQPLSKADIDTIRGVQSDGVIKSLIALGLIKIVGRDDNIGRAFLYGTTRLFLKHFGLKGVRDLPRAEA